MGGSGWIYGSGGRQGGDREGRRERRIYLVKYTREVDISQNYVEF